MNEDTSRRAACSSLPDGPVAEEIIEAAALQKLHIRIRLAGGIVHSDGNIFFTKASNFLAAAALAAPSAQPPVPPLTEGEIGGKACALFKRLGGTDAEWVSESRIRDAWTGAVFDLVRSISSTRSATF